MPPSDLSRLRIPPETDTPQYAKKRTKKIRFTVGIKMVPTVKNERKNMKNVKPLAVIDSETLMNSEFRERRFCVETLLPQGLCMLLKNNRRGVIL